MAGDVPGGDPEPAGVVAQEVVEVAAGLAGEHRAGGDVVARQARHLLGQEAQLHARQQVHLVVEPPLVGQAAHERGRRWDVFLDAFRPRQAGEAEKGDPRRQPGRHGERARHPVQVQPRVEHGGKQVRADGRRQQGGQAEAPADPGERPSEGDVGRQLGGEGQELEGGEAVAGKEGRGRQDPALWQEAHGQGRRQGHPRRQPDARQHRAADVLEDGKRDARRGRREAWKDQGQGIEGQDRARETASQG
jgi:hypothetical protein